MASSRGISWTLAAALLMPTTPGCTEASDLDPDAMEPSVFYVSGAFGYDPEAARAVPYEVDGVMQAITLAIEVAAEDYFTAFDERFLCHATLTTEDAQEVTGGGALHGVELPSDAVLDHDCAFGPSSVWGAAEDVLLSWTWGLGVGTMDAEVGAALESAVVGSDLDWEADWAPWVVGGGLYWDLLEPYYDGGYSPSGYAFAYETDEDMVVLDSDGDPYGGTADAALLRAEDIGEDLPRGAYTIRAFYGFDASYLLGL